MSRREMLTFGVLSGGAMLIPLERSVLAAAQIIPGFSTRIWGHDGSFPGPTFDVQQGR